MTKHNTNKNKQMLRQQDICENLLNILDDLLDDLTERAGYSLLTQAIKKLCKLDFEDFFLISNITSYSETNKEAFFLRKKHFIISLLWTLRLQTKAFRISEYPYNHPYFRAWEFFGKKINSELELWNGCLDFIDTYDYPLLSTHKTAIDGFYWTTYENMLGCYKIINRTINKEEFLKGYLEEIQSLNKGENIYNYNEPDERNLYNLVDLAINIKKRGIKDSNALKKAKTNFINSCWKPYIEAEKECYKTYKATKEFKMTCVKNDKLKMIISGRQMVTIFPLATNSLKLSRKKKTLTIGSV
jgi:hypothetical protein